jgi:hypothetical protein
MGAFTARPVVGGLLVVSAVAALTLAGVAQERDRAKIPDRYKWNLADIYPTSAAWRSGKRSKDESPRENNCDTSAWFKAG